MGDAVGEGFGLARAGPGDDQERSGGHPSGAVLDGGALGGVEVVEIAQRFHHHPPSSRSVYVPWRCISPPRQRRQGGVERVCIRSRGCSRGSSKCARTCTHFGAFASAWCVLPLLSG